MTRTMIFMILLTIAFSPTLMAQENSAAGLFDSPVKVEAELQNLGESVHCSLPLSPASGLFGATEIKGLSSNEFLVAELQGSYSVYRMDENCTLLDSWTTTFPGTTMTGITFDTTTGTTYWAADPSNTMIVEFELTTGVPTGNTHLFPNIGTNSWGPGAIDNNRPGRISYWAEISTDEIFEIDLDTGISNCSFMNPDYVNGLGAFGNGIDDAVNPALNGTDLVVASGSIVEGQPVRASQTDCSADVYGDTWDLDTPLTPLGETFVNGIVEYQRSSAAAAQKGLLAVGNATSNVFLIDQDYGIDDCQGVDAPTADVLYWNGIQGEADTHTINLPPGSPFAATIQKPDGSGNGKYVVHINDGFPSAETIRPLPANLGFTCFPFLLTDHGSPVSVWNNIGRPAQIGASNYFGSSIANPERAPAFFHLAPIGDTVNMPSGSEWTVQGLIFNPASSSPKGASVTNAIQLRIE